MKQELPETYVCMVTPHMISTLYRKAPARSIWSPGWVISPTTPTRAAARCKRCFAPLDSHSYWPHQGMTEVKDQWLRFCGFACFFKDTIDSYYKIKNLSWGRKILKVAENRQPVYLIALVVFLQSPTLSQLFTEVTPFTAASVIYPPKSKM